MASNKVSNKVAQFVEGLNECWPDFQMTAHDFKNPTLDIILKFYERFIHEFGIRPDAIMTLLNNEYYQGKECDDLIYVYVVYYCATYIYYNLNLNSSQSLSLNLTFNHFINPSADKSLIMRISLLVNYLFYAKMTIDTSILPIREKILEEVESLSVLQKEIKNINENLKEAAITQVRQVDKLEKLANKKQILKNKNSELELELEELQKIIQTLKPQLKQQEEENDKLTERVQTNLIRRKQLETLIVNNPENKIAEHKKLQEDIQEEISLINDCRISLEIKTEISSQLQKNFEIVCNLRKGLQLQNILGMYNKIHDCKNEFVKISKETVALQRIADEERNIKLKLINEQDKLKNKLQTLELKSQTRIESLHEELDVLKTEYEETKKQHERDLIEATELDKSFKYINDCCEDYKEAINKQNNYYEHLIEKVVNADDILYNKFADVISCNKK